MRCVVAERVVITMRPADRRTLDALAKKFDMSRDHTVRMLIQREASRRVPA